MWITLAGLLPLSALAYLILFKWREVKNHPVALSVLFFVILSACMAAISRQSFGAIGATAPRYVLLQALFLAVLYLLFINIFASRAKYFLMFVICGSLLLYGARLVKGVYSMNHHKEQLKRMIVVYHLNLPEKVIFNPGPDRIKKILDRSAKLGFYAPPALKDDVKRAEPFRPSNLKDMPESLRFNIDLFKPAVDTLQIIGWAFSLLDRKQEQSIGILLQSDSDSLVIPAMMYERKDVVQHFKNQIPDIQPQCGFSLYMDLSSMKLQPGEFRIGICLFKDRKLLGWIKTDKSIKIENTTTEP